MNIVFSHCTQSFPIKFSASNTKADFLARGLARCGAKVTFINGVEGSEVENFCVKHHHGFDCFLFPKGTFFRIIFNIGKLLSLLASLKSKSEKNILFVGGRWQVYLIQLLFAKMIGYKCVWMTQEWEPSLFGKTLSERIAAYICTHWYGVFLDAFFPISHFLWNKYEHFSLPMHIIPVLSDFERIELQRGISFGHFSYCAGAAYYRVLVNLLEAYKKFVESGGRQKLILVLYGRKSAMNRALVKIQSLNLESMIEVKQQISDEELFNIYLTSLALLIPLDPNSVADHARFSQKIAEYVSTGRPIITSEVGEIPYYFVDKESALIVDYSVEAYSEAMLNLSRNVDYANYIGHNGYEVGKKHFDFIKNGHAVYTFLKNNV